MTSTVTSGEVATGSPEAARSPLDEPSRERRWTKLAPVAIVFALLAAFPAFGQQFYVDLAVKVMIYAILAMSLELLVGQTGLISFGHAAFFGIGAYATVLVTGKVDQASLWLAAGASIVAAALYALAVGALSLRTKGIYFIMITLAFAQMAYFVFHDTAVGGGSDGIYLYYVPAIAFGSTVLLELGKGNSIYYLALATLVATFGFLAVMLRSRFGRALAGIKANEQRMRAAGFPTYPYKLGAFVLAAAIASIAGMLFAMKDGVVNPELLAWHQSGAVLIMIILGGLGHLRGAMLGALAFTVLQELFQSQALFGSFAKHWQLLLGLAIIGFVAALPHGLIGLRDRFRRRGVAS